MYIYGFKSKVGTSTGNGSHQNVFGEVTQNGRTLRSGWSAVFSALTFQHPSLKGFRLHSASAILSTLPSNRSGRIEGWILLCHLALPSLFPNRLSGRPFRPCS